MQLPTARRFFVRATPENPFIYAAFFLLLSAFAGGCSTASFDIVEPAQLVHHIGADADTTIELSPLTYRLRSIEDRLVIRIYNPTDDPLSLLGPDSYVVDPDGQSHPVVSQTIAPRSFIKLILPPLPPDQTPTGPSIAFGISSSGIMSDPNQPRLDRPLAPRTGEATWPWNADGVVRLSFRYRFGSREPFTHSFSIRRQKR